MSPQPEQPHPDPDMVIQSDWIQMPPGHEDDLGVEPVGRVAGQQRDHFIYKVPKGSTPMELARREETEFVFVVNRTTGVRTFERFDPKLHGEWAGISDTGLSPAMAQELQTGFGDQIIPEGHEIEKERKAHGGASRRTHPLDHHRAPRKAKHK